MKRGPGGRGRRLGVAVVAVAWALVAALAAAVGVRMTEQREAAGVQAAQGLIARAVLEDPINRYDPLLGWKHIPEKRVSMEAAFPGEGIEFRINADGFRADREYTKGRPPDKIRIVAVGDSFTFGNVRGDETWPALLEAADPRLEVINMGASAYGLDQMYLWYREDGTKFEADIVLCALIEDDLRRAFLHKWVSGHGRPRFDLVDGKLTLLNVPVPARVAPGSENTHPLDRTPPRTQAGDPALPLAILDAFRSLVEEHGARFVVVHLPVLEELSDRPHFGNFLTVETARRNIRSIDLTTALKHAVADDPSHIFRPDRHYNADGNRLVARALHSALAQDIDTLRAATQLP